MLYPAQIYSTYLATYPALYSSSPEDYRSISILPSLSKALKILIEDQSLSFVIRFGPLNFLLSGFHSVHSTTTVLNNTDDFHKVCERRLVTFLLLFDFSKAFEHSTLHHLQVRLNHDFFDKILSKRPIPVCFISGMNSRAWHRFSKELSTIS
jgi:hypothetical protein